MQTHDYPLIFVVENNSNYNELIVSYLRSNKKQRIECFLSVEECLQNLYKKPDIVIQDYLLNEISGHDILKESKNCDLNTEFIFMSGLDNFSKGNNQNAGLISLSEPDEFDVAADTIKYGPHEYVVKDLFALEKLIEKFGKMHHFSHRKKRAKVSLRFS